MTERTTENYMAIDCFAGGGGATTGIEAALGRPVDIAVDHDPDAILMHKANHPDTLHLTEDIFAVSLQEYVKGRHVALMWASPDCTSHSKAKGSQPRDRRQRALPWAVYKHAKAVLPDVIIMENVKEIQQWGPLDADGRPIPERKGEDYRKFMAAMASLGYMSESRELVAADYGAPTTRKRWYAMFRRDGRGIAWPKPTHAENGAKGLAPWEPIYKYLNMDDMGASIFTRKKPLAPKTMDRIARGIKKFILECPNPFIMRLGGHNRGHGAADRLALPFITKYYKSGTGQGMDEPLHTITTSPGHFGTVSVLAVSQEALAQTRADNGMAQRCTEAGMFLMGYYGNGTGQDLRSPLHTIITKDRFALVTVSGNRYVITDILLRMLTPEELKLGQGFPKDYIISHDCNGRPYPVSKQTARIGNSVVPVMAQKLVEANCACLRKGHGR